MNVFRAPADYPRWPAVADLIHRSFAYMTPILGQPVNAMKVTPEDLVSRARQGTAWLVEKDARPIACLFTRPSRDYPDALYLGGLAVDTEHRGRGLAQALVAAANEEARRRGYAALTLDTGRALVELHQLFARLGFEKETVHDAVIAFRKPVMEPEGNAE